VLLARDLLDEAVLMEVPDRVVRDRNAILN
jgi:hypothetical protein